MAEKHSGTIGKCPMLMKALAAIRKAIELLHAVRANPNRKILMESSRMARRP